MIATYALLDAGSGEMLAMMEANWLTDLRTAATSAVATDLLARNDAQTLGIFGAGRQAIAHLTVLPRIRNFRRFLVCGSDRSDMKKFASRIKEEQGIEIEVVSAEACTRESDVICTCTTASEPVFDGSWLRAGAHLNLVGAFQQDRATGIAGTLGATSKMIPVNVSVKSSLNATNRYKFEVASDRFLTAPLMNFIVFNAITASERALGEMTLYISGQIHLKNQEPVNIGNVFSSDMNGPAMASIALRQPPAQMPFGLPSLATGPRGPTRLTELPS